LAALTISIILPVYNPAEGWEDIVLAKSKELAALYLDMDFEVMVVNDGSTSPAMIGARRKLQPEGIKLIEYNPNKGKGEALRTGVKSSSGGLVLYTDIDFPYTMTSITKVIDLLKNEKADVVIGVKDQNYYTHVPPIRRFISRAFRFFVRLFLQIPTDDTQCGLKGFNQKGKDVFLKTTIDRYLFDLEFVFLSSRDKAISIKIQEIQLRPDVYFRKMNWNIIRGEAWNFLKILVKA